MKDEDKTKEELINELNLLRKYVVDQGVALTKAKQSLDELKKRYGGIFSASNDAFLFLDEKGNILDANPAASGVYGFTKEEMMEFTKFQKAKYSYHALFKKYQKKELSGDLPPTEWIDSHKDGTPLNVEVKGKLFEHMGKSQFLAIVRDITKRKRVEKELQLAREEFLSTLIHDLKSPLSSIMAYLQLLLDPRMGELPEKKRSFVHMARNSGEILLSMINNIVNTACIESGKLEFKFTDFLLDELLEELHVLFQPLALLGKVSLEFKCPEDLWVYADRERIRDVFFNLVSNALRYTPENGTISISATLQHENVLITVSDTGKGIPPQYHDKIFEKYQRVKDGRSGFGLGLYIVRNYVEGHGSNITLKSEPDKGASFSFILKNGSPQLKKQKSRGVILIAGEVPEEDYFVKEFLSQENYMVDCVSTGNGAVEKALSITPDVILIYNGLPDLDVMEFKKLLQMTPSTRDIPLMLVSPKLFAHWEENFAAVIPLPLNMNLLLKKLERIIDEKRSNSGG